VRFQNSVSDQLKSCSCQRMRVAHGRIEPEPTGVQKRKVHPGKERGFARAWKDRIAT
jgi:hypothetical protein